MAFEVFRRPLRLLVVGCMLVVMLVLASATVAQVPVASVQAASDPALGTEASALDAAQLVSRVNIYMIALDDNGRLGKRIGCGDSVVPVRVALSPTNLPLRAALNQLFAVQSSTYAGRYNALYRSTLSAGKLSISGGRATLELFGGISINGVCDSPRVIAQIEETALQFPNVQTVTVLVNGVPIRDVLSER